MPVTTAQTAGFCFGVARAVEKVEEFLKQGKPVCTLGPLIHNPHFIDRLSARGAFVVQNIDEVPAGYTLVIRTHGVTKEILDEIERRGIPHYNATCPFVEKIRKIVAGKSANGTPVLIAGDASHPEVLGTRSCCSGESFVFADNDELTRLMEKYKEKYDIPPILV